MIKIVYQDKRVLLALKPAGVLADDSPGGMPELIRQQLGDKTASIRPVHRLDAAVSGLMLFARSRMADSILSKQVEDRTIKKYYLAVVHGRFEHGFGRLEDLLYYDREKRMSTVKTAPGKDVRMAELNYEVLEEEDDFSLVKIELLTGRTHQIRVQFASRGHPIYADKKYGKAEEGQIALFSSFLSFVHPESGEYMGFEALPEKTCPWDRFSCI